MSEGLEQLLSDFIREGVAYGIVARDSAGKIISVTPVPADDVLVIKKASDKE